MSNILNRILKLEKARPKKQPRFVVLYPGEFHGNEPHLKTEAEARAMYPGEELSFIQIVYTDDWKGILPGIKAYANIDLDKI